MPPYDAIIVGGGASGLMCAATAAQWGKKVLLLEHNPKLGRKILASGGGNCNFTNFEVSATDYQSKNSHFCKSALSKYQPDDFIALLESYGVAYYEKKLGQLFCSDGATKILEALKKECHNSGVEILVSQEVRSVSKEGDLFNVNCEEDTFTCKNLVMATGGLSFKGLGATDIGYRIATKFGLNIVETTPALVPLLLGGYRDLAGLALPVEITVGKQKIADDFLFTHLGFSGPAVLKASLYWNLGEKIMVNFLPEQDVTQLIEQARKKAGSRLWPKS